MLGLTDQDKLMVLQLSLRRPSQVRWWSSRSGSPARKSWQDQSLWGTRSSNRFHVLVRAIKDHHRVPEELPTKITWWYTWKQIKLWALVDSTVSTWHWHDSNYKITCLKQTHKITCLCQSKQYQPPCKLTRPTERSQKTGNLIKHRSKEDSKL